MFGDLSVTSLSLSAVKLSVVVVEGSLQLMDVLFQLDISLVLILITGAGARAEISHQSVRV